MDKLMQRSFGLVSLLFLFLGGVGGGGCFRAPASVGLGAPGLFLLGSCEWPLFKTNKFSGFNLTSLGFEGKKSSLCSYKK
nr:hypothetical protein [Helicobacter pylori]